MAIVGDEFTRAAEMVMPYFDRGVRWAEEHLPPDRITELHQLARSMSFSDFARLRALQIRAAIAEIGV